METFTTVSGIKELNQKITKMERSLDEISKSLATIAKIMNRQVPKPVKLVTGLETPEDEDDLH